jgi:hypothetical protein
MLRAGCGKVNAAVGRSGGQAVGLDRDAILDWERIGAAMRKSESERRFFTCSSSVE